MKAVLGVVGLLLMLGVVSLLVKKQLPAGAAQSPPPLQAQQAVRQQLEAAMQQARPASEEK
jgi:hypothetical protein